MIFVGSDVGGMVEATQPLRVKRYRAQGGHERLALRPGAAFLGHPL
jgi:hypothetical protein